MKKCIVFDFDGVIINSKNVQKIALREVFKEAFGSSEAPYEKFFENSGNSLENIFDILEIPTSLVQMYRSISKDKINEIQLYKGIVGLLDSLKSRGFVCALCTGKERSRTLEILSKFDLLKYFNVIVCSDDIQHPKPAIDCLLKIEKELSSKKEDMIMIGDGINDILCAHNAQIDSIAVTWGDTSIEKLLMVNPKYVVNSPQELLECILR